MCVIGNGITLTPKRETSPADSDEINDEVTSSSLSNLVINNHTTRITEQSLDVNFNASNPRNDQTLENNPNLEVLIDFPFNHHVTN